MPSTTQTQFKISDLSPKVLAQLTDAIEQADLEDAADLFLEERGDTLATMQVVKAHNYPNETGDHQILTSTRMTVIAPGGEIKSVKARRCIKFSLTQVREAADVDGCPVFWVDYLDPWNKSFVLIVRRDHVADPSGNLLYTQRVDIPWTQASDQQEGDMCTPELLRQDNRFNRLMAPARATVAQLATAPSMEARVSSGKSSTPTLPGGVGGGADGDVHTCTRNEVQGVDPELEALRFRWSVIERRLCGVSSALDVRRCYLGLCRRHGVFAALQAMETSAHLEPEWCEPSQVWSPQEIMGLANGSLRDLVGVWSDADAQGGLIYRAKSQVRGETYTVHAGLKSVGVGVSALRVTIGLCDCKIKDAARRADRTCAAVGERRSCVHRKEAGICPQVWYALSGLEEHEARLVVLYQLDHASIRQQAYERIVCAEEFGQLPEVLERARVWADQVKGRNLAAGMVRGLVGRDQ